MNSENQEIERNCPLFGRWSGKCVKNRCMWYLAFEEECAIKTIACHLADMKGKMK